MPRKKNDDPEAELLAEMEEVNPDWFTSGCIIHKGKVHLVTVHISLLIMQTRLYAETQAGIHERDAKTASTASFRLLMERIARDLRRWATDDQEFLESSTPLWQCSVALAVRAKLGYLSVTPDNFSDYVDEVLLHALPARRSIPPTFVLLTGPCQPELFVTQESVHLANCASEWIFRQVVSKADLKRLFNRVAEQYPEPGDTKEDKPVAKPERHVTDLERLGVNEADREKINKELLDFVFFGVPSKNFSHSPPARVQNRRRPQGEENKNKTPPAPQPRRDETNLARRREALLSTARLAGIPVGLSDVFALDVDALEARLATNPAWREDSIQKVLQAAKHAAQPNSEG